MTSHLKSGRRQFFPCQQLEILLVSLGLPSALIVAGGDGGIWAYTAAVEIFKLTRYITVVHS